MAFLSELIQALAHPQENGDSRIYQEVRTVKTTDGCASVGSFIFMLNFDARCRQASYSLFLRSRDIIVERVRSKEGTNEAENSIDSRRERERERERDRQRVPNKSLHKGVYARACGSRCANFHISSFGRTSPPAVVVRCGFIIPFLLHQSITLSTRSPILVQERTFPGLFRNNIDKEAALKVLFRVAVRDPVICTLAFASATRQGDVAYCPPLATI
ncbi:hypothetical protein EVAR_35963_1 [Eumeta japonica]|uniref:Uncharacterized protein n=1 Tax=Eumeta variegata TaxID=151549 RepID=A0A4C1W6A7_EUMVA|nr:hypothetical protein EVAR_35963_1 [Eumeta japonica]